LERPLGGEREEKAVAPASLAWPPDHGAQRQAPGHDGGPFPDLVIIFKVVAIIFVVIEGVALLLIGVRMTRSMTRAVDTLYDATERVKAGFFLSNALSFRDQLTALAKPSTA